MSTPNQPAASDIAAAGELAVAASLVVTTQFGHSGLLVRRMGILPSRALELMNELEQAGVVGPSQGVRSRDVYVRPDNLVDLLEDLRTRASP